MSVTSEGVKTTSPPEARPADAAPQQRAVVPRPRYLAGEFAPMDLTADPSLALGR